MTGEGIPTVRCIAKPKEFRSSVADASRLDVLARPLAFFALKLQFKELRCPLIESQNDIALAGCFFLLFGFFNYWYRYSALLGDYSDCFREAASFYTHYKIEDASADTTAETLEEPLAGVDRK